MSVKRHLYYLKALQNHYGCMQPDVRDAIDYAIKILEKKQVEKNMDQKQKGKKPEYPGFRIDKEIWIIETIKNLSRKQDELENKIKKLNEKIKK